MGLDTRAVRILTSTYWSSAGWNRSPSVSPSDFDYAKSQGVMFEPILQSHDQAIEATRAAVSATQKSRIVRAFVASLSSRRLDLRSALGSYAVGRHMQSHSLTERAGGSCAYCGLYRDVKIDNVLSFERIKWGGVRHTDPGYIAFDLGHLSRISDYLPSVEDISVLRSILDVAGSMPATARPNLLAKALSNVLPSNSAERRVLIEILGHAGVLIDPARPAFFDGFVPVEAQERTPWHTDDWAYPVQWWNGSHGVNRAAVDHWFGELLKP